MRRPFPTHLVEEDGSLKEIQPSTELGIALLMRGRSWGGTHTATHRTFACHQRDLCDPRMGERTHGEDLILYGRHD